MRARGLILLCLMTSLALSTGGCGTVSNTVEDVKIDADPNSPVRKDAEATGAKVGGAVAAPLQDVNLIRKKIPPVLLDAVDAPYALPRPISCKIIEAQVRPLDVALGPDIDQPKPEPPSKTRRDEAMAGDAAIDTIKGTAESVIPLRGFVRMLSGAERHDKQVQAAVLAGEVRRAYLKGLGLERRCPTPGAPLKAALEAKPAPRPVEKAADTDKP